MSECTTYWRTKERHIRQSSAHAFNFSRIEYRILLLLHLVSTLHSPLWMHRMFECALRFFKKSIFSIHNSYIREKRAQVISRQKITCETFGHISFVFCFWAPVHFFCLSFIAFCICVAGGHSNTSNGRPQKTPSNFIHIYLLGFGRVCYLFVFGLKLECVFRERTLPRTRGWFELWDKCTFISILRSVASTNSTPSTTSGHITGRHRNE